jgi:WD40 repeat protein
MPWRSAKRRNAFAAGISARAPEDGRPQKGAEAARADVSRSIVLRVASNTIWAMDVLPDGWRALCGVQGGKAILSSLKTGEQLREFDVNDNAVYGVASLPDGRQALFAGLSSGTFIWDLETGERLRRVGGADDSFVSIRILRDGKRFIAGATSGDIVLLDLATGDELRRFVGHSDWVRCIDVSPDGRRAISGSDDKTARLWDLETGAELGQLLGHTHYVRRVVALRDWKRALSASNDGARLWDLTTDSQLRRLGADEGIIWSLAILPDGKRALSGGGDATIRIWDLETGQELRRIEGHSGPVNSIVLLPDGKRFAAADSGGYIRVWPLDDVAPGHHLYTTARVALLGDSGVGKTGLGWRIAHGAFLEQPSTHGQQFWVVDQLGETRADGTQCETVLWDLAGQPDYRLIHALFLDNVDLGLLLFDPANRERPLSGVEYWIKHLGAATLRQTTAGTPQAGDPLASTAPTLLIAARSDRGTPTLTDAEIEAFCHRHGIAGYVRTSALENVGIDDLMARIKTAIPWHRLTPTVTTDTFKRIKDHVLRLKEAGSTTAGALRPADDLRRQLQATDPGWRFDDAEMLTAVQHLANHGYVALIQRADGGHSILLASDLLINLASSVVLEARRHERGLGMVDEARLLNGDYALPELSELAPDQRRLLLDETVRLFL